jgi:hypothetical protein
MNSERRHELTAAHHLLYLALIGRDWRKAFTPFSNQHKLANGLFWSWGLFRALAVLYGGYRKKELLEPFEGLITSEMLGILRSVLPQVDPYRSQPDQFTRDSFPFDAYKEPPQTEKAGSNE